MLNKIEKLREKSPEAKKKIAFLGALFFSGLIFVVWLSIIYPNFKEEKGRKDKVNELHDSPFATFSDLVYSSYLSLKGEANDFKVGLTGNSPNVEYVKNEVVETESFATSSNEVNRKIDE